MKAWALAEQPVVPTGTSAFTYQSSVMRASSMYVNIIHAWFTNGRLYMYVNRPQCGTASVKRPWAGPSPPHRYAFSPTHVFRGREQLPSGIDQNSMGNPGPFRTIQSMCGQVSSELSGIVWENPVLPYDE